MHYFNFLSKQRGRLNKPSRKDRMVKEIIIFTGLLCSFKHDHDNGKINEILSFIFI